MPPTNALEGVPAAPAVVNRTNGAVSNDEARSWADANNRDSGWYVWAEANDQPSLLSHLVGPSLVGADERTALENGATIADPSCIYPVSESLFPLSAPGRAYFTREGLTTAASYVFVVGFGGPCSAVATYPDGHTQLLPQDAGPVTAFVPGELRHDPALGDIWFTDAGGGCKDAFGPPPEWCGR